MTPGRLTTIIVFAALSVPMVAPANATGPTGTTLPWNLLDCRFVYATVNVPAKMLTPYMASNWRPYALNPTTANTLATIAFEIDDCAEGSGISGQIEPMQYASTWVYAVPPPAYANDAPFNVWTWDVLVPDAERRALLVDAHAPARDGWIAMDDVDLSAQIVAPFHVDYEMIGAGSFAFDVGPSIAPPSPGPLAGGEFGQYIRGSDGSFTFWRTFWRPDIVRSAPGFITLDAASWQAQALGTTVVPAQFSYGTWDYYDGKIVVPG